MKWLAGVFALLLAGCATTSSFVPQASSSGEVVWRRDGNELAANVEFQRDARDFVRFVVTRERVLLAATESSDGWRVNGSLVRGGWQGHWNTAPENVAGWLTLAEAWRASAAAPDGESEERAGRYSVLYRKDAGVLRSLEMVSVATGDRFRVRFTPPR